LLGEELAATLQIVQAVGGKLDTAKGLRRVGRRRLIDWDAFKAAIERSDLE
jgi:hypothetical protein